MYSPIIVYSDKDAATNTATILRDMGNSVRVAVEESAKNGHHTHLFVVQAPFEKRTEVVKVFDQAVKDDPTLLDKTICCPECGSKQVLYPDIPQGSSIMKGLGRISEWFDNITPGKSHHSFRCVNCELTWEKQADN